MIHLPLNAANLKLSRGQTVSRSAEEEFKYNRHVGIVGRLFRVTDPPKISKRPSK